MQNSIYVPCPQKHKSTRAQWIETMRGRVSMGVKVNLFIPGKSHVLIRNISEQPLPCFTGTFVKLLTKKKRKNKKEKNPPTPPSKQVSIHHHHPPATFAHWPHSSPETQYLTTDKQLTHLFFWGTRWLAPNCRLAAHTPWAPVGIKTDNPVRGTTNFN